MTERTATLSDKFIDFESNNVSILHQSAIILQKKVREKSRRVASGPRMKLASCKSALKPPVVYSTDRSKAEVPVLVLLFSAL